MTVTDLVRKVRRPHALSLDEPWGSSGTSYGAFDFRWDLPSRRYL